MTSATAVNPPAAASGPLLGIGAAAAQLGVSERALRYYQQLGLLTPSGRTPGGLRRYSAADLARVERIRELQTLLGFNLDEIKGVLGTEDRLAALREEYRSSRTGQGRRRELLREILVLRERLRETVQAKIERLEGFRADLDASIERIHDLLASDSVP